MKRIQLLLLGLLISFVSVMAQKNNDFRYDMAGFEFEIRKINKLGEKPKYLTNPEHLVTFGLKYMQYYNRLTEMLEYGDPADKVKTDFYERKSSEVVDLLGEKYTKNSYEYDINAHRCIHLFYNMNNELKFWEMDMAYPYALDTAAYAFVTANQMHIRDLEVKQKLTAYLKRMRMILEIRALGYNNIKDYDNAFQFTKKAIYVMKGSGVDSTAISASLFNAGYFAFNAQRYAEAEKSFLEALDYKFKEPEKSRGGIYQLLAECARQQDSKDRAFDYAKMGLEAYPDLIDLLYEVINGYVAADDTENALVYLDKGIALEPGNTALLILKASLIEESGDIDRALETYYEVIKYDPENYKAYNHIAIIKYKRGKDLIAAAMEIDDNKEYMRKLKEACLVLYECVEPMEKCVALEPDNVANKKTLRSVYVAIKKDLAKEHPELEAKYKAIDAELKAIDKGIDAELKAIGE